MFLLCCCRKKNKVENKSPEFVSLNRFNIMKNNIRNYKALSIEEKEYIRTMSNMERIEIIFLYDSIVHIENILHESDLLSIENHESSSKNELK